MVIPIAFYEEEFPLKDSLHFAFALLFRKPWAVMIAIWMLYSTVIVGVMGVFNVVVFNRSWFEGVDIWDISLQVITLVHGQVPDFTTVIGAVLVSLVLFVLVAALQVAHFNIALRTVRSEALSLGILLRESLQGKLIWRYAITQICISVIVLIGIFLFIIPGIIFALTFSMALWVVVDQHCRPLEALKRSAQLTKGVRLQLLSFIVVLIVVLFLLWLGGYLLVVASAFVMGYPQHPGEVALHTAMWLFYELAIALPLAQFSFAYLYEWLNYRAQQTGYGDEALSRRDSSEISPLAPSE